MLGRRKNVLRLLHGQPVFIGRQKLPDRSLGRVLLHLNTKHKLIRRNRVKQVGLI
jgi:hypothetical protein